jgi:hypothetical protein
VPLSRHNARISESGGSLASLASLATPGQISVPLRGTDGGFTAATAFLDR